MSERVLAEVRVDVGYVGTLELAFDLVRLAQHVQTLLAPGVWVLVVVVVVYGLSGRRRRRRRRLVAIGAGRLEAAVDE